MHTPFLCLSLGAGYNYSLEEMVDTAFYQNRLSKF
jgi:hypothetical protein